MPTHSKPKSKGPVSLAYQVDILFEWGKARGLSTAYQVIAEATGESRNNIHRIHRGENINPGLRTLAALAEYFGVDLGYFSCKTAEECLAYIEQRTRQNELQGLAMRADGISPAGMDTIRKMIEYVRHAEGLDGEGARSETGGKA